MCLFFYLVAFHTWAEIWSSVYSLLIRSPDSLLSCIILFTCLSFSQPVVHIRTVRQSATILSMNSPLLRTGDRAHVHFKFMYNPEYISVGSTLLFREGRTKGMGKITKLIYPEAKPTASKKVMQKVSRGQDGEQKVRQCSAGSESLNSGPSNSPKRGSSKSVARLRKRQ